ncbi:hypothetical protein P9597_14765 [Aneurinibacillus migulanus]|uniref:hypothetical protein n=1 Tax=Aneurinibacillus migulanus TaxID=47500 RepID=UPI002E249E86|nr:hypothetical protein [Aneurinibacillus migulanus]
MDEIKLVIKTIDDQDYTDIYINNKRLVEILREFEQPHRSIDSAGGYWSYDKLKPFVFDRKQYEAELSKKA